MDFIKFNIIKNACLMSKVIKKPGSYMIGKNERCFICIPEVNDDVVAILDISSSGMCIKSTTSNSLLSEPLNIEVDGCPLGDNWKTIKHESEIKFGNIYAKILCFKKDLKDNVHEQDDEDQTDTQEYYSVFMSRHSFISKPHHRSANIDKDPQSTKCNHCQCYNQPSTSKQQCCCLSDEVPTQPYNSHYSPQPSAPKEICNIDIDEVPTQPYNSHYSPQPSTPEEICNIDIDEVPTQPYNSHCSPQPSTPKGICNVDIDEVSTQPYNSHSSPQSNTSKSICHIDLDEVATQPYNSHYSPQPSTSKGICNIDIDEVPAQPYSSHSSPQPSTSKGNCNIDLDEVPTQPNNAHSSVQPSTSKGICNIDLETKFYEDDDMDESLLSSQAMNQSEMNSEFHHVPTTCFSGHDSKALDSTQAIHFDAETIPEIGDKNVDSTYVQIEEIKTTHMENNLSLRINGSAECLEESLLQNMSSFGCMTTSPVTKSKALNNTDMNTSRNLFGDHETVDQNVGKVCHQNIMLNNQISDKEMDFTDQNPSTTVLNQSNEKKCVLTGSPVNVPCKRKTDCLFKGKKSAKFLNDEHLEFCERNEKNFPTHSDCSTTKIPKPLNSKNIEVPSTKSSKNVIKSDSACLSVYDFTDSNSQSMSETSKNIMLNPPLSDSLKPNINELKVSETAYHHLKQSDNSEASKATISHCSVPSISIAALNIPPNTENSEISPAILGRNKYSIPKSVEEPNILNEIILNGSKLKSANQKANSNVNEINQEPFHSENCSSLNTSDHPIQNSFNIPFDNLTAGGVLTGLNPDDKSVSHYNAHNTKIQSSNTRNSCKRNSVNEQPVKGSYSLRSKHKNKSPELHNRHQTRSKSAIVSTKIKNAITKENMKKSINEETSGNSTVLRQKKAIPTTRSISEIKYSLRKKQKTVESKEKNTMSKKSNINLEIPTFIDTNVRTRSSVKKSTVHSSVVTCFNENPTKCNSKNTSRKKGHMSSETTSKITASLSPKSRSTVKESIKNSKKLANKSSVHKHNTRNALKKQLFDQSSDISSTTNESSSCHILSKNQNSVKESVSNTNKLLNTSSIHTNLIKHKRNASRKLLCKMSTGVANTNESLSSAVFSKNRNTVMKSVNNLTRHENCSSIHKNRPISSARNAVKFNFCNVQPVMPASSSKADTINSKCLALSSKISCSPKTQEAYCVTFTGDSFEDMKLVVKKLGGEVTEDPAKCTHLIANEVKRTFKFLHCVSKGIPILSKRWLIDCEKANQFIDCNSYILFDKMAELKYSFCLKNTLKMAKEKPLFKDWNFHVTKTVLPHLTILKDLIESAGGKFLNFIPTSRFDRVVVVSNEKDVQDFTKEQRSKFNFVTNEFVLTGLLRYKIDFRKYSL